MNYPFLLKFSNVSNLSDARYAAGMWADFIGFCFDPSSPDYIEPAKAKEIAGWVNGPLITGEFGNQPPEWISDFVKAIPLHALQLPGDYENEAVVALELPIILKVANPVQGKLWLHAKCLLTNDLTVFEQLKGMTELPVILEVSDTSVVPANTPEGIALAGKSETSPGTRNQDDWTTFLEKYSD